MKCSLEPIRPYFHIYLFMSYMMRFELYFDCIDEVQSRANKTIFFIYIFLSYMMRIELYFDCIDEVQSRAYKTVFFLWYILYFFHFILYDEYCILRAYRIIIIIVNGNTFFTRGRCNILHRIFLRVSIVFQRCSPVHDLIYA